MRTQLDACCIGTDSSLRDAISAIDRGGVRIALMLDENGRLVGTLTDGDIRRRLLGGMDLDGPASQVVQRKFHAAPKELDPVEAMALLRLHSIDQLPIIDADARLLGLYLLDDLLEQPPACLPNAVVIMAGGKGTRLRPHTDSCPKPMLLVGDKPMLEILLEQCIACGFRQFYLSVNYLKEQIIDYFLDGSRWGVSIEYLVENEPLGTAGSLQLLPEQIMKPFLVLNGDVLTRLNPTHLLSFHRENQAQATVCVREHEVTVPFGVVQATGVELAGFEEKPTYRYLVNAGIYVIDPQLLTLLPVGRAIDMPTFIEIAQSNCQRVIVCPIHEYWIDVGRPDSLRQAHDDWTTSFTFFPGHNSQDLQ